MLGQSVNSRKLFGIKDVKTFAKKNTEKVTFRMMNYDSHAIFELEGDANDFEKLNFKNGDWINTTITKENQEALDKLVGYKMENSWMIPHDTAEKLFSFTFWDEWDEMDEQPIDNITEKPISYF